jgi:hypothetical protein
MPNNPHPFIRKLSDAEVSEMRALYAAGSPVRAISRSYGCSYGYVWDIVHNRARVPGESFYESRGKTKGYATGEHNASAKLTVDNVRDIRGLYVHERWTYKRIAEYYGVHPKTVQDIVLRRTWKEVR